MSSGCKLSGIFQIFMRTGQCALTNAALRQPAIQAVGKGLFVAVMVGRGAAGDTARRPQLLLEITQGQPFLNVVCRIKLATRIEGGHALRHQPRRQQNIGGDNEVAGGSLFHEVMIRLVKALANAYRRDQG